MLLCHLQINSLLICNLVDEKKPWLSRAKPGSAPRPRESLALTTYTGEKEIGRFIGKGKKPCQLVQGRMAKWRQKGSRSYRSIDFREEVSNSRTKGYMWSMFMSMYIKVRQIGGTLGCQIAPVSQKKT